MLVMKVLPGHLSSKVVRSESQKPSTGATLEAGRQDSSTSAQGKCREHGRDTRSNAKPCCCSKATCVVCYMHLGNTMRTWQAAVLSLILRRDLEWCCS
jgi:hypothetical protein